MEQNNCMMHTQQQKEISNYGSKTNLLPVYTKLASRSISKRPFIGLLKDSERSCLGL